MVEGGNFIIPAVIRGNLVLMPEPARGWIDDPMKLYHDTTVFPHHQYIAAYLWLKHGFGADAMIHLGTHATPRMAARQAGRPGAIGPARGAAHPICPISIPTLSMTSAKGCRPSAGGRGVVIDHLIPPLRAAGLYAEYARLQEMIGAYDQALAMDSQTAAEQLEQIGALMEKTGIDADLRTAGDRRHRQAEAGGRLVVDADLVHELKHYLMEIKTAAMPYGMHTFGRSPAGELLDETVAVIGKTHPEQGREEIAAALRNSGKQEMDRLIHGLAGRYVPAGRRQRPRPQHQVHSNGQQFFRVQSGQGPLPARLGAGQAVRPTYHRQAPGRAWRLSSQSGRGAVGHRDDPQPGRQRKHDSLPVGHGTAMGPHRPDHWHARHCRVPARPAAHRCAGQSLGPVPGPVSPPRSSGRRGRPHGRRPDRYRKPDRRQHGPHGKPTGGPGPGCRRGPRPGRRAYFYRGAGILRQRRLRTDQRVRPLGN